MFIFLLLYLLLLLDEGHSLSKEEKIYNPIEFWDRLYFLRYHILKLTQDERGILVVEFHTNDGPLTFTSSRSYGICKRLLPDFAGSSKQDCDFHWNKRRVHCGDRFFIIWQSR